MREVVFTGSEDSHKVIVSKLGLEFVSLHQHGVPFDEIVVEGCLLYHLGHPEERN